MVEVICDTNFLIHLATKEIKNISNLETDIGSLNFIVPKVVVKELLHLSTQENKKQQSLAALEFIKNLKTIEIDGNFADKAIISYIKKNGGFVATLDKNLKKEIKGIGGSIISLSNNRIVLEPSKI